MKQFIVRIVIFSFVIILLSSLLCVFIDPFNVFHANSIRYTYAEPNKNYIKMKYILDNPQKYDSFLFGSSRVGFIHTDNITDETCYNMTYGGGNPKEHLDNIKTLINHNIIPKHIYIGLDNVSYMISSRDERNNGLFTSPYEYSISNPFSFWSKYLNPSTIGDYIKNTLINGIYNSDSNAQYYDDYIEQFYKYGWNFNYGIPSSLSANVNVDIDSFKKIF